MDTLPETRQHDDVMVHTAHQLTASLERVRQARRVLHDASDRLTQSRHEMEKDPHIERVRRARAHLDTANDNLAETRRQWEPAPSPNAAGPVSDDDPMTAAANP